MKSFLYKYSFLVALLVIVVIIFVPLSQPVSEFVLGQSITPAVDNFVANPPIHLKGKFFPNPVGLTPKQIYAIYHLPGTGGSGTVALIDAYDYPVALSDLNVFNAAFGLPVMTNCTSPAQSACFEKHMMSANLKPSKAWAYEASLDVQWSHAVAPNAHILLVEANSGKRKDLMDAVAYANSRSDVVAVSMSWGGKENAKQLTYDANFYNAHGATYFAASGDSGASTIWPATAPNVVSVGGTTLNFNVNGTFASETAWSGSGGGLSTIEAEPSYQALYGVPQANGRRATPDVSFDGDPNSGVAVYDSIPFAGMSGWAAAGGTSVGSPMWAGIRSLGGGTVNNLRFYQDAASANYSHYFRDITVGNNGTCGFYCNAGPKYDYVTGLGSPLTVSF